ncbi:O-methyltransferase [Helicobacter burdigaliensis]|uniref:O-methyltransferase n=1 Tax=Helicobacter burdigaliensis TaxID=2315334 RepID=UPI001E41CB09|nr:class I SAM-dependent methyltransferase [Helicobacter burdigaliensis]
MNFEEIVEKVEARRSELMSKDELVEVVDYGAGNPDSNRTKEEMTRGVVNKVEICKLASVGMKNERLKNMYDLLKEINPKVILELGTCCGFSSSYMAYFVPDSKIYTIEGSGNLAKIARDNHSFFGLENIEVLEGRFDLVLPNLLSKIAPIDFAFIDGHHDKEATLKYYRDILPFMAGEGVMLFDDISWSEGMKEAWEIIKNEKRYKKIQDYVKIGAIWL